MYARMKHTMVSRLLFGALAFGMVSLSGITHSWAQESDPAGTVRIQGELVGQEEEDIFVAPSGPLVDYPEEMRRFIQSIAQYARRQKPDFVIVVEDALSLLTKTDIIDETQVLPARTYARSIDGVIATGLFHGDTVFDQPFEDVKRQQSLLALADRARKNGLPVLVLDKASLPDAVERGRAQSSDRGYVYGAMPSVDFETAMLPSYPKRPYAENPMSIISLPSVKNFAVVGNSLAYGRQDEFALKMHGTNYDMLVVDVFHGRKPLSKQAVETLKYKKTGTRRLVMARVDIGTAASYRYYWKDYWGEGAPSWIGGTVSGNPDRHYVEFWNPEWQRVIAGDASSYIFGVLDQGYDGVVLSGADVHKVLAGGENAQ